MRVRMLALVALVAGCGSPVGPSGHATYPSGVPLLVTNSNCVAGQCTPLRVLAFPGDATQPATPGGLWHLDLGVVDQPQTCLFIPPSATFRIIGQHENAPVDTVAITWTTANPISLAAVPVTPHVFNPSPTTGEFIPATQTTWHVTLPGTSAAEGGAGCPK